MNFRFSVEIKRKPAIKKPLKTLILLKSPDVLNGPKKVSKSKSPLDERIQPPARSVSPKGYKELFVNNAQSNNRLVLQLQSSSSENIKSKRRLLKFFPKNLRLSKHLSRQRGGNYDNSFLTITKSSIFTSRKGEDNFFSINSKFFKADKKLE